MHCIIRKAIALSLTLKSQSYKWERARNKRIDKRDLTISHSRVVSNQGWNRSAQAWIRLAQLTIQEIFINAVSQATRTNSRRVLPFRFLRIIRVSKPQGTRALQSMSGLCRPQNPIASMLEWVMLCLKWIERYAAFLFIRYHRRICLWTHWYHWVALNTSQASSLQ